MIYLWLLLALCIPILIHLFSFRRAKKIYFSNLRFVTNVSVQSKSRSLLKHLLILATRIVCFALILFFYLRSKSESTAGPVVDGERAYLDRTASMYIGNEPQRSIDEGAQVLEALELEEANNAFIEESFESFQTIISDFQGVNLEALRQAFSDSSISRNLIVTGDINGYRNAFIDSVNLELNPDDLSQVRITLFPEVSPSLQEGSLVFRLLHESRQLSSIVNDISNLNLVTFDIPFDLSGKFIVEIEGDDVYYDNEFRFVIPNRRKAVVSLVEERGSYLANIFANEELFTVNRMTLNSLDFDAMNESDLIVLNGVANLPSGVTGQLANKAIVTFPPANQEQEWEVSWMGFDLLKNTDTAKYEMDIDAEIPLFLGAFTRNTENISAPYSRSMYQIGGDYEVMVSLRDGSPLLVRNVLNDHYLFNVALDLAYTNLPTSAIFLPIMYRIAFSTVQSDDNYYYHPNDLASMAINPDNRDRPPKILGDEIEVIPEFNPSDDGLVFLVPDLNPGFYTLQANGDTTFFAVNTAIEESHMAGLTVAELKENLKNLNHVAIQSADASLSKSAETETSLLKYALILVLIVLVTETLLHKYLK